MDVSSWPLTVNQLGKTGDRGPARRRGNIDCRDLLIEWILESLLKFSGRNLVFDCYGHMGFKWLAKDTVREQDAISPGRRSCNQHWQGQANSKQHSDMRHNQTLHGNSSLIWDVQ